MDSLILKVFSNLNDSMILYHPSMGKKEILVITDVHQDKGALGSHLIDGGTSFSSLVSMASMPASEDTKKHCL